MQAFRLFSNNWVVQLKLIWSAEVQRDIHFVQLLNTRENEGTLTAVAIVFALFLSKTHGERWSDNISRKLFHFETEMH